MHKFSSADTALLLRLASSLPTGDESRRAILSSLSGKTATDSDFGSWIQEAIKEERQSQKDHGMKSYREPSWLVDAKYALQHNDVATLKEIQDAHKGGAFRNASVPEKTATDEGALELPGHTMAPDEWNPTMPAFSMQGNSVDRQLQASALGADFERVRELTDQVRGAKALPLPVPSGTRVTFAGHFGSVFAYENPPQKGAVGEVVTVRSATGDITSHDGMVFVKWADGTFLPVHAEHLRVSVEKPPRVARHFTAREIPADVNRFKVAGLGDISQFLSKVSNDTLVHKSQKDLWSFSKGADGGLTVQRLFSSDGEPLKG